MDTWGEGALVPSSECSIQDSTYSSALNLFNVQSLLGCAPALLNDTMPALEVVAGVAEISLPPREQSIRKMMHGLPLGGGWELVHGWGRDSHPSDVR